MEQSTAKKLQLTPLQSKGPLPIYGLRKDIQSLIEERAKHDTHRDFCLCSLLAISAVCLSQITIDSGDYKNHPTVWFLLVGSSSYGKSPVVDFFNEPLKVLQDAGDKEYQAQYDAYEESGAKGGVKKPTAKRYYTTETTFEGMIEELYYNKRLLIKAGEAGAFYGNLDKYGSKSGVLSRYCDLVDGRDIPYDRKTSRSFNLTDYRLSFIGETTDESLSEVLTKNMFKSGYAQRHLIAFPEPPTKEEALNVNFDPIPSTYKEIWKKEVDKMLSLPEQTITLDPDALEVYHKFKVWTKEKNFNAPKYVGPMYSKLNAWLLRIAGIVHFLSDNASSLFISASEMNYVVDLIHGFIKGWLKAFKWVDGSSLFNRPPKQSELIRYLHHINPKATQNMIADAVGCGQPYVSQVLKGYED